MGTRTNTGTDSPAATTHTSTAASSRAVAAIAAILAVAALGFGVVAVRHLFETPQAEPSLQFAIPAPQNVAFGGPPGGGTGPTAQLAISPDGRLLVFVGRSESGFSLWLRSLGALDARPIPGTEDGSFPFWSPDNRYIGFFAAGKLKKVSVAGGPPLVLCDALSGRGGTWNRDNVIVFSPSTAGPLQRVPAAGGAPQLASALDPAYGESSHRFPSFLPDGRHFLFSGVIGTCCPAAKQGRIRVGALDTTDAATLVEADSSAAYSSGYVLFHRDGTLMATSFDLASRRVAGDPFPITEHVGYEGSRYASFTTSSTGTLIYAAGGARLPRRLMWIDRAGRTLGTLGETAIYINLALSSDERHVAATMATADMEIRDIWILDVATGTPSRFTFEPGGTSAPLWTADDSRIVFQAFRDGRTQIRIKRVEGTTQEEVLIAPEAGAVVALTPTDWSTDSKYLVYSRTQGNTGSTDVFALPLGAERKPFALLQTPTNETNGILSPNGKWMAYQATEGAQPQVFVQPFPPTGGKFQISREGGFLPTWRADGKELFFVSASGRMMAATVISEGPFQSATPTGLFSVAALGTQGAVGRQYAVTKDGRFLVNTVQQQTLTMPLTVVTNWLASVQR